MPPQLALLICIFIILYIFWVDRKKDDGVSRAIWIPLIWMFLAGSRYASQWLNLTGPVQSPDAYLEGSPLDAAVFFGLILAGVFVLARRNLNLGEIIVRNPWICLFFLFGAVSLFWSDYPFVSLKRWIKTVGNVVMALVILTEEHPHEAIGVTLRRFAFLFLPLSVLFIKYYPELGRGYHMGQAMFTGIALQKNGLGQACLISGIYFFWDVALNRRRKAGSGGRSHLLVYVVVLAMIAWLFHMANSVTSLMVMIVAASVLLIGRFHAIVSEQGRFIALCIGLILFIGFLELALGLQGAILAGLGRDATLTTRVPMWNMLLEFDTNPLIGVGFEIFWSGERLIKIWEDGNRIIQAHNGYVDLYLNLGIVGLLLISGSIVSGIIKTTRRLQSEPSHTLLRIAFIVSFVLYNWTEAAIKPINNMFLLLLLGILDTPAQGRVRTARGR